MKAVGLLADAEFDGTTLLVTHGFTRKSTTTYRVDQISGVNFREATMLQPGYILFNVGGVSSMPAPSAMASPAENRAFTRQPNVVTFKRKANQNFARLRDEVEQARQSALKSAAPPPPAPQPASTLADEIAQLKSLLDAGAITPEEFSALKAKLLV